jgi:outer membrane protein OmpA-like peptidoglycan-associated protein
MTATAVAGDVPGSADHPLVGRFEGAEIVSYARKDFDQYPLLIRKVGRYGGIEENRDAAQMVEGRLTQISYRAPAGRSTLEIARAYEEALKAKGFEILFQCVGGECGGRDFNHASSAYRFNYGSFGENYVDQRYLAARLEREGGDVYASIYTVLNTSSGGPDHDRTFVQVDVVEVQPRSGEIVVVKADEMERALGQSGHIALYGIYFDTDKTEIKPESAATLEEIAKVLESRPDLKLLVVGHTDNQGGLEYNMDLSRRRAAAVVRALTGQYGIDPGRLSAHGVGYLAPVASNASEEGRAKNRRVELVAQ